MLEAELFDGSAYRIGYGDDPWAWVPQPYIRAGRWDDPNRTFRVLYASGDPVACFVEAMAPLRARLRVTQWIDRVRALEGDPSAYPTAQAGTILEEWRAVRRIGVATLTGRYCAVSNSMSIADLRTSFEQYGRDFFEVNAGIPRDPDRRDVTQAVSEHVYSIVNELGVAFDGIAYGSQHGDDFALLAVFERTGEDSSPLLSDAQHSAIHADDPNLIRAIELLDLRLEHD